MQQGIVAPGKVDSLTGRKQASICRANIRVLLHRNILTEFRLRLRLVVPNGRRVLAMGQDDQRRMLEKEIQSLGIVHQHVAS